MLMLMILHSGRRGTAEEEGGLYWPTAPEKAGEERQQEVEVESARPSQAQLMAFKEGKQLIFG